MDKLFQHKRVVVTGGASGIGKGIVHGFAAEGAEVVFADLDVEAGGRTRDEIIEWTGNRDIRFIAADLSRAEDLDHFVQEVQREWDAADVLVNNVGKNFRSGTIMEHTLEDFEQTLRVNVLSSVALMRKFLPEMIKRRRGSIVNISSTMSYGAPNVSAYAFTKGGINTLTVSMALDHAADGVRINAVAPGIIRTPLTESWINAQEDPAKTKGVPMGRVGEPSDIAGAVLFLASDRASYITGHVLVVDGGLSIGE